MTIKKVIYKMKIKTRFQIKVNFLKFKQFKNKVLLYMLKTKKIKNGMNLINITQKLTNSKTINSNQ